MIGRVPRVHATCANAHRAAAIAMSDVAISGSAMWRSRIPVRSMITGLSYRVLSSLMEALVVAYTPSALIFAFGNVCP